LFILILDYGPILACEDTKQTRNGSCKDAARGFGLRLKRRQDCVNGSVFLRVAIPAETIPNAAIAGIIRRDQPHFPGSNQMSANTNEKNGFEQWAATIGATVEEIDAAWQELQRRGLVSIEAGSITVSPLAMRRATSDTQRRLASHLAGYLPTENSFIVRRAGAPPGLPSILNTRITVEQIASYFKEGWGVAEIERDLQVLTRVEIEAAIQYYLNHRAEIERDLQRSRDLYEANAPKPDMIPV
jgi:uncharacterized protein (DUF433 family)